MHYSQSPFMKCSCRHLVFGSKLSTQLDNIKREKLRKNSFKSPLFNSRRYKSRQSIHFLTCFSTKRLNMFCMFSSILLYSIFSIKFRLLPVLIPWSFSHLLLKTVLYPLVVFLESLPVKKRWCFPRLAFVLLSLNQFKSAFLKPPSYT